MTYHEAIEIRTAQLQGARVHPETLDEALAVIAARANKVPRSRTYGISGPERRRIDKAQIRLLQAELGDRA